MCKDMINSLKFMIYSCFKFFFDYDVNIENIIEEEENIPNLNSINISTLNS